MSRHLLPAVLAVGFLYARAAGQGGQFWPMVPPPFPLDDVQGEVVNYDTPQVRGLVATSDGLFVVAANEPDDRVSVFDAPGLALRAEIAVGQGISAIAERAGPHPTLPVQQRELWVVLRNQAGVAVIDRSDPDPVRWRVTHLLRPPVPDAAIGAGESAFNSDIVFGPGGARAYVSSEHSDAVLVFDAPQKTWLRTIPLELTHNGVITRLNQPRVLARAGNTLYVASHVSGNQTIAPPFLPFGFFGRILDLDDFPGFKLPDYDIGVVDLGSESMIDVKKGVGTVLTGLAVQPGTGRLIAANLEHRNGELIGERSFPDGRVAFNRLTLFAPQDPPSAYQHVVTEDLVPGVTPKVNVTMPAAVVADAQGRVFVAGFTSRNIGVFDGSGAFLGTIPTASGPRSLARAPGRIYVLCRNAGRVQAFDVSGATLPAAPSAEAPVGRHDPTYDRVRAGRDLFYDSTNSGAGTASCASCHVDMRKDGLAWDLSKYHDVTAPYTPDAPPSFWQDRKRTMVTQDLRSLEDNPPYHWRGEQADLEAFNGAFENLLKGVRLSDPDFALFKDFVFSVVYPPNPFQRENRSFSTQALEGVNVFTTLNADGSMANPRTCADCHSLPTGTDCSITVAFIEGDAPVNGQILKVIKTTQLRGLWTKASAPARITEDPTLPPGQQFDVPATGFGFDHQGAHLSVDQFVQSAFNPLNQVPGAKDAVIRFLHEYDSGLAPFTMYSEFVTAATLASTHVGGYALDQVNNRSGDLAGKGRLRIVGQWVSVGLLFDRTLQAFVFDDSTRPPMSWPALQALIQAGDAEVLMLGTPLWSGERIGVDRDRDAVYDADESALGTDPAKPDTDGDGLWDSIDPNPLVPGPGQPVLPAPQVSNVRLVFATANSIKLTYETDTFSPTRVNYGPSTAYGQSAGDPLILPPGSNHWKRRHQVVLRLLEDDATVHFRIRTRGQTGAVGGTQDLTAATVDDEFAPNLRVGNVDLQISAAGGVTTFTATAVVVDNHGQPVGNAGVNGFWTFFRNGAPLITVPADGTTAANGVATITISGSGVQPGDEMDFTVPMFRRNGSSTEPGVVDDPAATPRRTFHWPESKLTSIKKTVL